MWLLVYDWAMKAFRFDKDCMISESYVFIL